MPRVSRLVIPGCPHHITQRGNNRQEVFFVDSDHEFFLAMLKRQSREHGLRILGYCLMTNHVHLVAVPENPDSLHMAIGRSNLIYTQHINRLHGRSGHLWQNRFFSCPLDEPHLFATMSYIERNPVRAGLVKRAWQYKWSSAGAHINGKDETGLLDMAQWEAFFHDIDWREFLKKPEDDEKVSSLRFHTRRGRPLGSDKFISKLETMTGRRLRPLKVGRPGKEKEIR